MTASELTERERRVLEAIIHSYVETAEPAGSRTIAKKFDLGISAATIRNTMSDLEGRGYLYHPHSSAGRMPTDLAYRVYVDSLMATAVPTPSEREALRRELGGDRGAIEGLLQKAAQMLGVLTQELGVAVSPSFENALLERLQLMPIADGRLLIVLVLSGGAARTIFVETSNNLPPQAVASVAMVLNERLSGLSLKEIRSTLRNRLRDAAWGEEKELLNIFIEEADQLFQAPATAGHDVVLGSAQMLAEQPEFHSNEQMRTLLELTQRRDLLRESLRARQEPGITVTIGAENIDPKLSTFTLVSSTYRCGPLSGVIGVMGPTRMPYQKVVALVEHTSRIMGEFLS